ncbi:MAG TPA: hypothetical protein VF119_02455 [Candidatus Limnocylindrales bacterium]
MGKGNGVRKQARQAIRDGRRPAFEVDLGRREVPALPGLSFGGERPAEIAEAARRSIAAELGVRADQIEVRPTTGPLDAVEVPG